MQRFLSRVILAAALMTVSAEAGAYRLFGAGANSCETWTADRSLHGLGSWLAGQWIVGFLSGVGYEGADGNLDPLLGVDAEDVVGWIDNYCRAHPLDNIGEAGAAFVHAHPH